MKIDAAGLRSMLSRELGDSAADVSDGELLFSSGILDSFTMISVVTCLEKSFGIRVRPVDITLENFDSLDRIARYVNGSVKA
jgi:acyl carrier protein